ncbi:hypothetical protein, partial [Lactiplantibacillus plantarum]
ATDALFLFSIISKVGLEKSEDFSRPVLFLETYVTASFLILWMIKQGRAEAHFVMVSQLNNRS